MKNKYYGYQCMNRGNRTHRKSKSGIYDNRTAHRGHGNSSFKGTKYSHASQDKGNRTRKMLDEIGRDYKLNFPEAEFSMGLINRLSEENKDELYAIRDKYAEEMYQACINMESKFVDDNTRLCLPVKKCYLYRDLFFEYGDNRRKYNKGEYTPSDTEKEIYDQMFEIELEAVFNIAWAINLGREGYTFLDKNEMKDKSDFIKRICGMFYNFYDLESRMIDLGYNMYSDAKEAYLNHEFKVAKNEFFFCMSGLMNFFKACDMMEFGVLDRKEFYDYVTGHFMSEEEREEFGKLYWKVGGKRANYMYSPEDKPDGFDKFRDMLEKLTFDFGKYSLHKIYG